MAWGKRWTNDELQAHLAKKNDSTVVPSQSVSEPVKPIKNADDKHNRKAFQAHKQKGVLQIGFTFCDSYFDEARQ